MPDKIPFESLKLEQERLLLGFLFTVKRSKWILGLATDSGLRGDCPNAFNDGA